jgi:hypothetical protein
VKRSLSPDKTASREPGDDKQQPANSNAFRGSLFDSRRIALQAPLHLSTLFPV